MIYNRLKQVLLPFISVAILTISTSPAVAEWTDTSSTIPATEAAGSQDFVNTPLKSLSPLQNKSYTLLLSNYPDCFYPFLSASANTNLTKDYVLPIEYEVTLYEKHDQNCGGDPNTMPLRASYSIDKYGRIFKTNVANATLDLQYEFDEQAVVLNNMKQFQHPTHNIFKKHHVTLNKVEKRARNSFVIFYVNELPDATQEVLFQEVLQANGYWDFIIRTDSGAEYYIEGNKRKIINVNNYH